MKISVEFYKIKNLIISEGERAFEAEVFGYDYNVFCHKLNEIFHNEGVFSSIEWQDNVEQWLKENLDLKSYIAFPRNAIGKYVNQSSAVYFKNASDAVLFKLIWG